MNSRKEIYGFYESEEQIIRKYPLENGVLAKSKYEKSQYTITYDIYTAYNMRKRNIPVVVWGKEYKKHRAFVFRKECSQEFDF